MNNLLLKKAKELQDLNKKDLRLVKGLFTRHFQLRYILSKMDSSDSESGSYFRSVTDTTNHLFCE